MWPFDKKTPVVACASSGSRIKKELLKAKPMAAWRQGSRSFKITGSDMITDKAAFMKTYADAVTRTVPSAAGAVWVWKNLCATRQNVKFVGGTEQQRTRAAETILELDRRISPIKTVQTGGMDFMLELWFKYIFTYGRFAGQLRLSPTKDGVASFEIMNPYSIKFSEKDLQPYAEQKDGTFLKLNPNTFYFFAMNMDTENPYGSSMLEAVPSLIGIANDMMEDMTLSSSNAGIPRLHIKIKQPQIMPGENADNYATRANNYFDSLVDEMAEIGPDDNFYTWDDVQIAIAGGANAQTGYVWRALRQIIDEEMCTAFHLYPWVLAKSYGTTKNWVSVQFDLLMAQAESLQREAKRFAEWIRNSHLMLQGIPVSCKQFFVLPRDPAARDMATADSTKTDSIIKKIQAGFISVDDGARELGYEKAFAPNMLMSTPSPAPATKHEIDLPQRLEDSLDEMHQILSELREREPMHAANTEE